MDKHPDFDNLYICNHPLILHKLTHMRSVDCTKIEFKNLLKELSLLMGYEVTRTMPVKDVEIQTPITKTKQPVLVDKTPVIAPILRAGLGMSDGLEDLIPSATIGHIGMYRDEETKEPVEYLIRLPDLTDRTVFLVDPMLATGNSAKYALDVVKRHNADMSKVSFMALLAAPEGVKVLQDAYPEVPVFVAAMDEYLNENAYIVPGLGDAGDRVFGTDH